MIQEQLEHAGDVQLPLEEPTMLEPQGSVEIVNKPLIVDAEWCFQFFNNEPIVFGWNEEGTEPTPLMLQIQPNEDDVLVFRQNGMEFKIFPRPISEKTKMERENASKNKEA